MFGIRISYMWHSIEPKITIYALMIYTAPCEMFLMWADILGGEVGGWGWRWKSRVLWALVKLHEPIGECYLGPRRQQSQKMT
jgi:hypothetical protein